MRGERLVLSVMTADVGGFVGHISSHPEVMDTAKERLYNARTKDIIADFHVMRCGDDLELIVTHRMGLKSADMRGLAENVFSACAEAAMEVKLHRPAFETLDAEGVSFGVSEMEFVERQSEPVVIFMNNKTLAGSWNLPMYRIFSDPFNTAGLIQDKTMLDGFSYNVIDLDEKREIMLRCPEDAYALLSLIGSTSRYVVAGVYRNNDKEIAATIGLRAISITEKGPPLPNEPSLIVRCQSGFPAVGEVIEPFTTAWTVEGWMRGSHHGPLMPVGLKDAHPSRFDGPPRIVALRFQLANGMLGAPRDMFDDPGY
ncbi:MAG: fructose 1,6-bisphosphatase, partial [Deltaproteobacteria bacterium]